MEKIKRALVISGGGAKGAWAGGLVHQMIEERKYDWDIYIGTSTGALLITLTSLKQMERLKEAYTSVTNNDIFSVNPFNKKGKIDILNAAWRLINNKTSLGESKKLLEKIEKIFTVKDFHNTIKLDKHLYACVVNYTHNKIEYGYNHQCSYDEYVKYTWASTSVPLAMDLVDINGSKYLDGGVLMHVPIQKAIDCGADEVDVIVLRPENEEEKPWSPNNMFDVLLRTINIMQDYISQSNVLISQLQAKEKDVKLRIRYTPYKLTGNSLMFDKKEMLKWWQEGYEWGRKENQSIKLYIRKK